MVTDDQVRLAIKSIIKTAYPTVQAYGWNALSHNLAEWPGMFRTTDFDTSGKTHGWIIKQSDTKVEWKAPPSRDRQIWNYDVWGFYGFRSGKETDNSDKEFSAIRETIYAAIKATPTLGLAEIERHDLLNFSAITTINCGEETLHFAHGRLMVRICC